jgi:hypothetical protein
MKGEVGEKPSRSYCGNRKTSDSASHYLPRGASGLCREALPVIEKGRRSHPCKAFRFQGIPSTRGTPPLTEELRETSGTPVDRKRKTQMPLQCVECGAESDQGYLWRAFIADDTEVDEASPLVVCYCPRCAARQFGPRGNPSRRERRRKAKRRG